MTRRVTRVKAGHYLVHGEVGDVVTITKASGGWWRYHGNWETEGSSRKTPKLTTAKARALLAVHERMTARFKERFNVA